MRHAIVRACAVAVALVTARWPGAAAEPALTRNDFIEAYVVCNNAAWAGNKRAMILAVYRPSRSDLMRGIDSVRTRGFLGEQLYYEGVFAALEPRRAATAGWALATKAYADRGGADPRFSTRARSLAVVAASGLRHAAALDDGALAALATDVAIASAHPKSTLSPPERGMDATAPLDVTTARAMLATIGTHADVGVHAAGHPGMRCPSRVLQRLFTHG